jgi:demethoxyubiquinone hydroxylase (CLK1/Coq7/Cat5 family)
MDNRTIINELGALMDLDFDAARAFAAAARKTGDGRIRDAFLKFRDDHARHIDALAKAITDQGGTPASYPDDLPGTLVSGMAPPRVITSAATAYRAIYANETLAGTRYAAALDLDLPAELRSLLAAFYDDELEHRAFINAILQPAPAPT